MELHRGGTGEPLVLLHGIGSCWQVWNPVIPALQRHFDVIAIDIPGFGRSEPIAGEPTGFALGEAVERILDDLGLERAHIVGNSMGGTIAAAIASHGRASSVTAISPGGLSTKREYGYALRLLRFGQRRACQVERHADALMTRSVVRAASFGWLMRYPLRVPPAEAAHQLRMFALAPSFAAALRWIEAERPMPPDLNLIDCPVTVLWGSRDLVLPARQAVRWGKLVGGAKVLPLPGAGHMPMSDAPEAIVRAIEDNAARAGAPVPSHDEPTHEPGITVPAEASSAEAAGHSV